MDRTALLGAIDSVDWGQRQGAYGGSERVPDALRVLASEPDRESDEWSDAMDVLESHVFHQGSVYDVTEVALPLMFRLIGLPDLAGPNDILAVLVLIASSTHRYRESDNSERRALGERLSIALSAEKPTMLSWLDGERGEAAAFMMMMLGNAD